MASKKQKKPIKKTSKKIQPGIRGRMRDWLAFPLRLKNKKSQAQMEMQQIQDAFILYRAQNLGYDYFATNTDRNLLNTYTWIQKELDKLASMEADLYFTRFSLKALRTLDARLDEVINKQKELERKIQQAPQAFEFYNRMSFFKSQHHQREKEEQEISRILSKAQKNLEHAQSYFEEYEKEREENPNEASILGIENVKEYWKLKIEEINEMIKTNDDPALFVTEIERLAKTMFDTPALTKWVDAVEKRFRNLTLDHSMLVENYGKRIIPKEIMDEFTDLLYSAVPKLWASGQTEQLTQYINELDTFISTYQTDVETEIRFAQRHERKEIHTTEKVIKLFQLSELSRLFISAMEARDPIMKTHSETVAHLAVATAKAMNWEQEEIQYLEMAGLLHDIGKLWIPDGILTKTTRLTEEEMKLIRMHPVHGAQILQNSTLFKKITPWIYHHQELWNGSGYPDGLKETEIPLQSRIISVCESFTAMLSGTPVKAAYTVEQALDRVKMDAGSLFDPVVVGAFVKVVESQEMEYLKRYVEK